MKRLLFLMVSLAILSQGLSRGQGLSQSEIQILQVGQFHSNEVSAKSGEVWFGLYPTKNGYELISSRITVEAIYDPIVDNKDEKTGKKVAVDQPVKPLFLVKGVESLNGGLVKTVFSGREFLYPGQTMTLKFDEKDHYALAAFGEAGTRGVARPFGEIIIYNYEIKISHSPWVHSQVLASFDAIAMDGRPILLWAGDLDRDGKLDLLMDLTNHYNVTVYTLFLSSMSKGNNLLQKVAEFRTVGC